MFAYPLASTTCSETTNMVYEISRFLTVVVEVKSEFILENFGGLRKVAILQGKYSKFTILYKKIVLHSLFQIFFH